MADTSDVSDLFADMPELWAAHEYPERPFAEGMWLCDCAACLLALRAEVEHSPRTVLCLKTNFDRVVVTAEYLLEALIETGEAESLCYVAGDWVREIFVPVDPYLDYGARWRSLTCWEDDRLAGRQFRPRVKLKRQTKADAARRDAAFKANPDWYLELRRRV